MTGPPIVVELTTVPTVTSALQRICHLPWVLLLDSAMVRDGLGRYSFLTADPFDTFQIPNAEFGSSPLGEIAARLNQFQSETLLNLPPFQGGAAGLLGYGLGRNWERIPQSTYDEFQFPDLAVGIYDWVLAWDHLTGQAWIISHGYSETDKNRRQQRAAQRIEQVKALLNNDQPIEASVGPTENRLSQKQLAPQVPLNATPHITSDFSRDDYLKAVEKVIEYIHAGDIFQANLSQRLLTQQDDDNLDTYLRLRKSNPATFAGYFAVDDWAIMSSSPERFLKVANGHVSTRPIKGTRQRESGPEADLFARDALRQSEKDQAENVMIVDLLRNDLSRVCQPGTIHVTELCNVETYQTVQHLVSEVRGDLRHDKSTWDLWAASFPGGSITGAPKVRAMEIIAELEPTARGPYCGSLFYHGFDGTTDSNILIRTIISRHGWLQLPVGGGIVADSDPVAEYEETLHKAAGMLSLFQQE